ncbi:outer membrane chaperone Skp (OmpH) [Anaeromyxobacter sp. K]|uniref:Outer membrane chaperone Skp (OmpH) n=1 Tax=Anaeromyxobacter dehalogenans (strain ATCC BAA-258 / DSM 21875 / 2CP-1) TaxID=455488 RepID=B8JFW6_ANAD2|nr:MULTISPECIES: OmpH family outer membrane protein [Anaeromyxobacter]ACG72374.1 outer membrane chaperone Skp (OmpH) [Anaeromyxobacter sp. K]ACL64554.1 outer membrane chaperone Skp (OmpH) [Anaeromyxobacter dehalogenans 2CP-1]
MRTLARLSLLALLLSATAARAAEAKFGFVDLQRAIREVDEGKSATAVLKKDFDEKQKVIDQKKAEFDKLKAEFDKQAVVMADQAKKDKASELDRKAMELQQLFVQLQKDLSQREGEVMRGIVDKMTGVIREIAEADGFTMVFERNDAGIVYAPQSLDLTNELVRKYNARFGAGSKAAGQAKKAEPAKPAAGKK